MAGPYLPPDELVKLKAEHKRLRELGYPPDEVAAHAAAEMPVFLRWVTDPEIIVQIDEDHDYYERGLLAVREAR